MDQRNARERPGNARIDPLAAQRSAARDESLRRLRTLTRASVMGATALVGFFAFVAAKALPGHKLHASTPTSAVASRTGSSASQNPDPSSAAPSLGAPAAPPAPTVQSPVVVSGGS